jgi:hypothetical protein
MRPARFRIQEPCPEYAPALGADGGALSLKAEAWAKSSPSKNAKLTAPGEMECGSLVQC